MFTVAIIVLGLAAAFAGKWLERVGPRVVGLLAAACWSGGFLIGSIGIFTSQLWLLYLGYGVVGGCGLGLGYISPVSTLVRWFPDRKGMATGLAIMGFGGGAMLGAPLKAYLIDLYFRVPDYPRPDRRRGSRYRGGATVRGRGRRIARGRGRQRAGPGRVPRRPGRGSLPGRHGFVRGGGDFRHPRPDLLARDVGCGAPLYRVPAADWLPPGWNLPAAIRAIGPMTTYHNVHIDQALRTPHFYQLWIMLCFNVSAGIGVLGVAETMVTEVFGTTLPDIVDGAFAATYVVAISVFNMAGRLFWSSTSDYIGRRLTYWIFFASGVVLYCSIPWIAHRVSVDPSVVWLVAFYAVTMLIFSMYGGGFATIPAYIADLFGTRFVGGIHGRLLTAWSVAGVLGPLAITSLRENAVAGAIDDLVAIVDPAAFRSAFGADIDQLAALVDAKTVTIAALMEIAPSGVADPTPHLYDTTMYLMAALLAVALLVNALMRPVRPKHHMQIGHER